MINGATEYEDTLYVGALVEVEVVTYNSTRYALEIEVEDSEEDSSHNDDGYQDGEEEKGNSGTDSSHDGDEEDGEGDDDD